MSNTSAFRGSRGSRGWNSSSFPTSRGWINRSNPRKTEEPKPSSSPPPRGELLIELKAEDVSISAHDLTIRDCRYVASYNWADEVTPTVIIPGKPPLWAPPAINRRLDPDKGDFYRDLNAARYPAYPMEPAVQAVLRQSPQFPTQDIDLVTCTSSLGNLSRFVRGVDKEFRIILARVGTTIFLVRRENSPAELIPNVRGYGHTFPDEYTMWERDVKSSVSHQRIVQYQFGGLHLLVRFEVDGYLGQEDIPDRHLETPSVIDALGAASIGHAKPTGQKGLQVKAGGHPVSQEKIFDLKTRSAFDHQTRTIKKEIDLTDILPRLWISQIPTLIVGYHERGRFDDIRVQDMRSEIERWELDNEKPLRRLASLLHELVKIASTSRTNLEICRFGSGPLEIRRLAGDGLEVLPSQLRDRWAKGPKYHQEASPHEDTSGGVELFDDDHVQEDARPRVPDYQRDSDDESLKDYTACSADLCGYCGRCAY